MWKTEFLTVLRCVSVDVGINLTLSRTTGKIRRIFHSRGSCILVIAFFTPAFEIYAVLREESDRILHSRGSCILVIAFFTPAFAFPSGGRETATAVDEVLRTLLERFHHVKAVKPCSSVLRFFFDTTGAKKKLRKKKRRVRFAFTPCFGKNRRFFIVGADEFWLSLFFTPDLALCGERPPSSAAHARLLKKARPKTFNKRRAKLFSKVDRNQIFPVSTLFFISSISIPNILSVTSFFSTNFIDASIVVWSLPNIFPIFGRDISVIFLIR